MITFDGIVIDRILSGVAENFDGDLLYRLTQLSEASIETSSEAKEAKDAQGILIKKTYKSKAVSFKATNALLELNVIGETTGSGKKTATASSKIEMPRIIVTSVKTTMVLPKLPVTGTVRVSALSNTGAIIDSYTLAATSSPSDTEFALTVVGDVATLKFPTNPAADVAQFLVKYQYASSNGVMIDQRADKFPSTIKFTLSVLVSDPCTADTLRQAYIVFPSFQVSPDTSISLDSEANFEFAGDAQVDYCSADKQLYYLVLSEDDIVE